MFVSIPELLRPRPVLQLKTNTTDSITVAKFYKSTDIFTCISNPSIHLSVSQVNDDYCDCPDGSDEPGTSACSYLSPLSPSSPSDIHVTDVNTTLALPGYYCKNKGHQGNYIPFLTVNDGVCDYDLCCDGSDEWAHVGGTVCEEKCKEIGKEWRKLEEQRNKALGAASRKRKELVVEAGRLRKEVEAAITDIQTQIGAQEVKVRSLEAQLAEVERKERSKVVRAPGKGSKVNVLAGLAKGRIEELRESLLGVRKQRDAGRERIEELEAILSTFKEEYNPNFNDEGVKRAVRSWEEYAARDKPGDGDAAHDRDLDEIVKPDSETGTIQWEEWERPDDESDVDVCKLKGPHTISMNSLLRNLKCTNLKNTSPKQCVIGSIRNCGTYGSSSSRTASSPQPAAQTVSRKQWPTRARACSLRRMI